MYKELMMILVLMFSFLNQKKSQTTFTKINIDDTIIVSSGIDISHYQKINWAKIDTSLDFIICKASEGSKLIDKKFNHYWSSIPKHMTKGAYHFFRPGVNGKKQADLFLSQINLNDEDMLPIIDVESTNQYRRLKNKVYVNNLNLMISEIERRLHVKPIIYTNSYFWNKYYAKSFQETDFPLWIADWKSKENPRIPKGWNDWSIWQYSSRGKISGISGRVDLNRCQNIKKFTIGFNH